MYSSVTGFVTSRFHCQLLMATMLALSVGACGGGMHMVDSQAATPGAIDIDGARGDWSGAMRLIEGKNVWLGVKNDAEFLYVTLATDKQESIRQIVTAGMTVWINSEGEKEQTLGIRFPVGARASGFNPSAMGFDPSARDEEQDREFFESLLEASTTRVEILTETDSVYVNELSTSWMKVAAELDDVFVYELQLALTRSEAMPYGVGASPGDTIVVGFTTPEFDRAAMQGQMGGGGGGGGRPGGGMGGGGRSGGMGGSRPSMPEPLEVWIEVALTPDVD